MKKLVLLSILLIASIANAATKNNHMFFDLAGVYMGTSNSQFKSDILAKGAIIPSAGGREFENTYDIFFDGEVIRLFAINHENPSKVDRIGVMIFRDSKEEILALLKSFTKREISKHNCQLEEFKFEGNPGYALLIFSPKDINQEDAIGTIDIRIVYEEDEDRYQLHIIYDDWVE